jgi:hypothetical protein
MGGEGEREQIFVESTSQFDSRTRAGTDRTINPVIPSPFRRREREPIGGFSKPEFDSIVQVGV